jgi:hypothetical protein
VFLEFRAYFLAMQTRLDLFFPMTFLFTHGSIPPVFSFSLNSVDIFFLARNSWTLRLVFSYKQVSVLLSCDERQFQRKDQATQAQNRIVSGITAIKVASSEPVILTSKKSNS